MSKHSPKEPEQEKRIYAVFPQVVQPYIDRGEEVSIEQPCGRTLAQAVHIGRKLGWVMSTGDNEYEPITTITLATRDTKEMYHIASILIMAKIPFERFIDTNGPVYGFEEKGTETEVLTAIITHPIQPSKVKGLLDYLPLWRHSLDVLR